MLKKKKISRNALYFSDIGCFALLEEQQSEESSKKLKLNMKVYSGAVIKNHWYWGDLVIDLTGIEAQGDKFPILENHDTSRKIGFSGKPIISNEGVLIDPETAFIVDTPAANEFSSLSKQGFPFQSSISISPISIERLDDDVETMVNGYSFKGPGTIIRKSLYKEASVCVFGWDENTSSSVSEMVNKSNEEIELSFNEVHKRKEDDVNMDIAELKDKYPDLVKAIQEEVKTELSKEISKKDEMEKNITELLVKLQESEKKVLELEKKDMIRAEREIILKAETIWAQKLAASSLSENIHKKITKHVVSSDFVKDGIFDVENFAKAVDAEIADWEKLIPSASPVIGSGFSKNSDKTSIDQTVIELASLIGIK